MGRVIAEPDAAMSATSIGLGSGAKRNVGESESAMSRRAKRRSQFDDAPTLTTSAISLRDGREYYFDDAYGEGEQIDLRVDIDDPDTLVVETLTLGRDENERWVLF